MLYLSAHFHTRVLQCCFFQPCEFQCHGLCQQNGTGNELVTLETAAQLRALLTARASPCTLFYPSVTHTWSLVPMSTGP